jgi:hypothetical protein
MTAEQQAAYAIWRMQMWFMGYGTTYAIDKAVERGDLIPGKEYPDAAEPFPDPRGESD